MVLKTFATADILGSLIFAEDDARESAVAMLLKLTLWWWDELIDVLEYHAAVSCCRNYSGISGCKCFGKFVTNERSGLRIWK